MGRPMRKGLRSTIYNQTNQLVLHVSRRYIAARKDDSSIIAMLDPIYDFCFTDGSARKGLARQFVDLGAPLIGTTQVKGVLYWSVSPWHICG